MKFINFSKRCVGLTMFFLMAIFLMVTSSGISVAAQENNQITQNCFVDIGGCSAIASFIPVGTALSMAPIAAQKYVLEQRRSEDYTPTYFLMHHDPKGLKLAFTRGHGPLLSVTNVRAVLSHLNRYCLLSIVSPKTNAWHLTSRFRVTADGEIWANPLNHNEQYIDFTQFTEPMLLGEMFKSVRFSEERMPIAVSFADDGKSAKGQRPLFDYFNNCRGTL